MSDDQVAGAGVPEDPAAFDDQDFALSIRVMVVEMAATWAVQQALQIGYRRITGRTMPSALDEDVPLHRILRWAAVSAAAVAVANVAVDRLVLRPSRRNSN
jgi:hypothetical protein